MIRNKPVERFPRSSNGRTAAFGAVNRGSNPCRGANLVVSVTQKKTAVPLYDFCTGAGYGARAQLTDKLSSSTYGMDSKIDSCSARQYEDNPFLLRATGW